jgi:hypothetical protein
VGQMLEKRRESRPGSWREIVDRLVAVLREAGGVRLPAGIDRPRAVEAATEATLGTELVGVSSGSGPVSFSPGARLLHETRLLAWLAAAGVVLVLSASWWAARIQPSARPVERRASMPVPTAAAPQAAAPAIPTAPSPVAGRLQILGLPFARVVSLVEARSGNTVPLPANATTPLLVTNLAPGPYRVVLAGPGPGGRTVERAVSVASGATVLLSEPFATPGSLAETLTAGEAR